VTDSVTHKYAKGTCPGQCRPVAQIRRDNFRKAGEPVTLDLFGELFCSSSEFFTGRPQVIKAMEPVLLIFTSFITCRYQDARLPAVYHDCLKNRS
jgi:hypothetical protein